MACCKYSDAASGVWGAALKSAIRDLARPADAGNRQGALRVFMVQVVQFFACLRDNYVSRLGSAAKRKPCSLSVKSQLNIHAKL